MWLTTAEGAGQQATESPSGWLAAITVIVVQGGFFLWWLLKERAKLKLEGDKKKQDAEAKAEANEQAGEAAESETQRKAKSDLFARYQQLADKIAEQLAKAQRSSDRSEKHHLECLEREAALAGRLRTLEDENKLMSSRIKLLETAEGVRRGSTA